MMQKIRHLLIHSDCEDVGILKSSFKDLVSIKLTFFYLPVHSLFEGYLVEIYFYLDLLAWNKYCCFPFLEN